MSIFKKKKNEQVKLDVPEVIKESVIKPTKCAGCFSVYQAKHRHIKNSYENFKKRVTFCPVCMTENDVEFEDDTV